MRIWKIIWPIAVLLIVLLIIGMTVVDFVSTSAAADRLSQSGYQCCAIALDTSRMGILLKLAVFLIGFATAALLFYKTWAGVLEVRRNDMRRALGWLCDFVSNELLPTITATPDVQGDARKKGAVLLQSQFVSPIIQSLGEFLKAAESGDEEAVNRIRRDLGEARSKLETSEQTKQGRTLTVYFIYGEDEEKDKSPPPGGTNWRATGKHFSSGEDADEYCQQLVKSDDRISKVMYFDTVYQDWTQISSREKILRKAEKNTRTA